MEPDVIVSNPASKKGFPLPKPVIAAVLVILIIVSAGYLTYTKTNLFKKLAPNSSPAPKQQLTTANFRKSLVKDIKTSFSSSKDAGILAYMDLASDEKDTFRSYRHYVSAFDKMKESYQRTKTMPVGTSSALIKKQFEQRIAMVELKNYAQILKYYKESDFVMPK